MDDLRRFRLEDITSLRRISGPRVSPDGASIVFSVKDTEYTENRYSTQLHKIGLDGEVAQFTRESTSNWSPVWSPSGEEVAFLSHIGDKTGIWVFKSGEGLRKITSVGLDASSLSWSPEGDKVLFTSKESMVEKDGSDVLVINRLPYKFNGLGFLGDKWNHLFTTEIGNGKVAQITEGEYNIFQPTWDPCGKKIAYIANKTGEAGMSAKNDIWIVDLEAGTHKQITDGKMAYSLITFSPDNKWLAARGNNRRYGLATKNDVYIIKLGSGESLNLTSEFISKIGDSVSGGTGFDYEAGLVWSPDSEDVYFLNAMNGNNNLYRVSIEAGEVTQLMDSSRSIHSFSFSRGHETLAFLATDKVSPSEIWISRNGDVRRLTGLNDCIISRVELSRGEKFTFTASDGVAVDCWYHDPVGGTEEKKPLILLLKGGPHMSGWGNAFNSKLQLLTANGYAVLLTNERGTGGYGEEFAKIARAKYYGQREYQDIMEALDHVLKSYPVDPNRVNVMGYSRGGFLTNWIITHTDMFNSAITAGGFCDVYSFFSTGDYMHVWCEKNYEGTPWDDEELYRAKSPIRLVKDITTPTLIMHGMEDFRCSVTQAEQLYVSMKRLKKDVEMVLFPGENHGLPRNSSPKHLREYDRHILRWFDKYNK
jgi:dipeptidyl aminopeptidase/acylaminoacyl peptidase